jgi:hypothetical protein
VLPYEYEGTMVRLYVRHNVLDYSKWRKIYDEFSGFQTANGAGPKRCISRLTTPATSRSGMTSIALKRRARLPVLPSCATRWRQPASVVRRNCGLRRNVNLRVYSVWV